MGASVGAMGLLSFTSPAGFPFKNSAALSGSTTIVAKYQPPGSSASQQEIVLQPSCCKCARNRPLGSIVRLHWRSLRE